MELVATLVFDQPVDQPLQGSLAKLGNPHPHRSDAEMAGEGNVVKADHRDVLRNPYAGRPKRLDRANRHIVVAGENGIELHAFSQQLGDGSLARFAVKNWPKRRVGPCK